MTCKWERFIAYLFSFTPIDRFLMVNSCIFMYFPFSVLPLFLHFLTVLLVFAVVLILKPHLSIFQSISCLLLSFSFSVLPLLVLVFILVCHSSSYICHLPIFAFCDYYDATFMLDISAYYVRYYMKFAVIKYNTQPQQRMEKRDRKKWYSQKNHSLTYSILFLIH